MATPIDLATAIMMSVDKLADIASKWMTNAEPRRMRRAIEYGERYIRQAAPILKDGRAPSKGELRDLEDIEKSFFKNN